MITEADLPLPLRSDGYVSPWFRKYVYDPTRPASENNIPLKVAVYGGLLIITYFIYKRFRKK